MKVQQNVGEPGEFMHWLLLPRTAAVVVVAVGQTPDDKITVTMMQLRQHYRHHAPTERLNIGHSNQNSK